MAQAAYCSQCKANVYVTDEGACPQGHGPESLSNYYDVPDAEAPAPAETPEPVATPTPAQAATPVQAATPAQAAVTDATAPASKSKLPWILGAIALLLVLCGIGSCVAIGAFFNTAAEELDSALEESITEMEDEMDSAVDELDSIGEDTGELPSEDIQIMVDYFYPNFTLESYYTVTLGDTPEDASVYHVIAAYDKIPEFRITFFISRLEADAPAGSDVEGQSFYDDMASAWWIHPETRDHALDSTFGPNALMVEAMLDQIASDFSAAHPTKVITTVSGLTNVDLAFQGIDEEELEDWYDDSMSFESTWELDMFATPSEWVEIGYEDL